MLPLRLPRGAQQCWWCQSSPSGSHPKPRPAYHEGSIEAADESARRRFGAVDGGLTSYDEQHQVTYLRLLDAAAEGTDWQELAKIVLHLDPEKDHNRARRAWESHLARARWMTEVGYRHLLEGGAPH